jgi:hypothetical protein
MSLLNQRYTKMVEIFSKKTEMLMQLHYSRLSEKDRRQYAALESLKLARGGISYISKLLDVHRNTIIQGRKELTGLINDVPIDTNKQLREGGGLKKNG